MGGKGHEDDEADSEVGHNTGNDRQRAGIECRDRAGGGHLSGYNQFHQRPTDGRQQLAGDRVCLSRWNRCGVHARGQWVFGCDRDMAARTGQECKHRCQRTGQFHD